MCNGGLPLWYPCFLIQVYPNKADSLPLIRQGAPVPSVDHVAVQTIFRRTLLCSGFVPLTRACMQLKLFE
jgi:hypothetical protein